MTRRGMEIKEYLEDRNNLIQCSKTRMTKIMSHHEQIEAMGFNQCGNCGVSRIGGMRLCKNCSGGFNL